MRPGFGLLLPPAMPSVAQAFRAERRGEPVRDLCGTGSPAAGRRTAQQSACLGGRAPDIVLPGGVITLFYAKFGASTNVPCQRPACA